MQRQRVDLWQQLVQRPPPALRRFRPGQRRRIGSQPQQGRIVEGRVPGRAAGNLRNNDAHSQRAGKLGRSAAEVTKPDDTKRLSRQLDNRIIKKTEMCRLLPSIGTDSVTVLDQPRGKCQQQTDRVLRDRVGPVSTHIVDDDSQLPTGSHIDVVISGRNQRYQTRARFLEMRPRQFHLVDNDNIGASNPTGHLVRRCGLVRHELPDSGLDASEIDVTMPHGPLIQKYCLHATLPIIKRPTTDHGLSRSRVLIVMLWARPLISHHGFRIMFRIGQYLISGRAVLAPMAGITDRPFRNLCRRFGAALAVSEMTSADPALQNTRLSRLRRNLHGEPEPRSVQIAGAEPEWMANAARTAVADGAQIVDINMGCPAKRVCQRLAGSALLSDPELVKALLDAVVDAVDVPVTLKIRTGPCPATRNGVRIAEIAEDAGIKALAVHGRTRADAYRGEAEYATIAAICKAVTIPVIANGDIVDPFRAEAVLHTTGAAAVMIGRGAQGRPWIFRQINAWLDHRRHIADPAPQEIGAILLEHVQQLHTFHGKAQGVRIARKHIGWYLQHCPGAEALRPTVMRMTDVDAQIRCLADWFAPAIEQRESA